MNCLPSKGGRLASSVTYASPWHDWSSSSCLSASCYFSGWMLLHGLLSLLKIATSSLSRLTSDRKSKGEGWLLIRQRGMNKDVCASCWPGVVLPFVVFWPHFGCWHSLGVVSRHSAMYLWMKPWTPLMIYLLCLKKENGSKWDHIIFVHILHQKMVHFLLVHNQDTTTLLNMELILFLQISTCPSIKI